MKKIFIIIILLICVSPVFADIGDLHEVYYTPESLESAVIPGSINERFFGRKGEEKQYFYTGRLRGKKGKVIFLLGAMQWDVIEGSILIHETKLCTSENENSYIFRPVKLLSSVKASQYRVEMSMVREYKKGKLFDFYKKRVSGLKMIIFPADSVSVWYLIDKKPAKALRKNY